MPKNLNANETENQAALHRKKLEQFVNDPGTEVTEEELNEVLEKELEKPESEIDLQLVNDLLETLEPISVDEEFMKAGQRRLSALLENAGRSERTDKKQNGSILVHLRRIAVIATIMVVVFFAALGSARALRWTFLLKYLEPIAQTFGIYTKDREEQSIPKAAYSSDVDENAQFLYTSENEIPETYEGYQVRLKNIPSRLQYAYGSSFMAPLMSNFSIFYQNDNEWLNYSVYVFADEDIASYYEYEKTINEEKDKQVGMKTLTYYHTAEDDTLSVSWIDRDAHYSIVGHISEEELENILNAME